LNFIISKLRENAQKEIITMGGFVAWHLKYSNVVDPKQPDPIYGEWGLVDLISQYYV
jgi:hypothetical protein